MAGTERDSSANEAQSSDQNLTTYFIGALDPCSPVKIGYSRDVEARMAEFQCGSPLLLHVLATVQGGRDVEATYHQRFSLYHSHGEWFYRGDDVRAEIERLNPGYAALMAAQVWDDDDV